MRQRHKKHKKAKNDPHLIEQARRRRGTTSSPAKYTNGAQSWLPTVFLAIGLIAAIALVRSFINFEQEQPVQYANNLSPRHQQTALEVSSPVEEARDPELEAIVAEQDSSEAEELANEIPFGPPAAFQWIRIPIRKGDTFFGAMIENGVARKEANSVVAVVNPVYDLRRVRPGQNIDLQLFGNEKVVAGIYKPSALAELRIEPYGKELTAVHTVLQPDIRIRAERITVQGSLSESFAQKNLPFSLLLDLANLLAWTIDFSNSVWPDDQIELLWEELWVNGAFYKNGNILAAKYKGHVANAEIFHFPSDDEDDEWYHRTGNSVRAAFLKAPLNFTRISSKFTRKRFHPVLKRYRPHSGVDFAAPSGTPVFSVADGVVIGASRMGGAGNAVRIRHNNGWITSYSHLSRILVKRGHRVRQKQRIGLVGSTGFSTGPHLDYRIKIGGKFVDPLHIKLPQGKPVPKSRKQLFQARIEVLEENMASNLPL